MKLLFPVCEINISAAYLCTHMLTMSLQEPTDNLDGPINPTKIEEFQHFIQEML